MLTNDKDRYKDYRYSEEELPRESRRISKLGQRSITANAEEEISQMQIRQKQSSGYLIKENWPKKRVVTTE